MSADLKGPKVKYKLHHGRCTGPLFRNATRHNTSCSDNKNIIKSSSKSSGDIQRKRVGQTAVSDNQSSSVTLNELAWQRKPEKICCNFNVIYDIV